MNELVFEKDLQMTSLEVVDLINKFRAEEGNKKEVRHDNFMASIRKEMKDLENSGVKIGLLKIKESTYINKQNKSQPCFIMDKSWVMQMCNKESAIVRYKTQQYIEALENKVLI